MERIKVGLRVRPFTTTEKEEGDEKGWVLSDYQNTIQAAESHMYGNPFAFDFIFDEDTQNADLYNKAAKELVAKSLDGIDTTIFVYGQTGSGKTHTMLGPVTQNFNFNGVIFNGLKDIFDVVKDRAADEQYAITASYLEIYNELVFDLLSKPENLKNDLTVFEDVNKNKFKVKNQTKVKVDSLEEVYKILKYGETNRRYAETYFNHRSSRSHTIFSINIQYMKYSGEEASYIKESTLNFVDLAGSERLLYEYKKGGTRNARNRSSSQNINQRSGSRQPNTEAKDFYNKAEKDNRMTESKHINKSLFFLTQVIFMCSKGKSTKHVPFRNSALTKILRSSFGGNSRTLLILCISPSMTDFDISLSTLRFGKCAKKIKNEIKSNVITAYNKEALQQVVKTYENKLKVCYQRMDAMDEKHKDMERLFSDLSRFKGHFIESILKFKEKAKIKTDLNKELFASGDHHKRYEDILTERAGIILFLKGKDEKDLMYNRKEKDQFLWQKIDEFKIKTIPETLHVFTEKLQAEEKLEEFIQSILTDLIEQYRIRERFVKKFIGGMKINHTAMYEFAQSLYTKISDIRDELSFFTCPERIKLLTDEQVNKNYGKVKKLVGMYQEENIRRKVLRDLNVDPQDYYGKLQINVDDKREEERIIDQHEFEEFKISYEGEFEAKIEEFNELSAEFDFGKKVEEVQGQLTEMIDKIYQDNYNIQKGFYSDYKYLEKRFKYFKAKYDWLERDLNTILKNKKQPMPKTKEESQFNSLRHIRLPWEDDDEDEKLMKADIDPEMQMLFDHLSRKIEGAVTYIDDFKKLSELRADNYAERIQQNVNKGLEPVNDIKAPSVEEEEEEAKKDSIEDEDDLKGSDIDKSEIDNRDEEEEESDNDKSEIDNETDYQQEIEINDNEEEEEEEEEPETTSIDETNQNPQPNTNDPPDFFRTTENSQRISQNHKTDDTPDFDADISKVNHLDYKSFVSDTKETIDMFKIATETNYNTTANNTDLNTILPTTQVVNNKEILNNFRKALDKRAIQTTDFDSSFTYKTEEIREKGLRIKTKSFVGKTKKTVKQRVLDKSINRIRMKKMNIKKDSYQPMLKTANYKRAFTPVKNHIDYSSVRFGRNKEAERQEED